MQASAIKKGCQWGDAFSEGIALQAQDEVDSTLMALYTTTAPQSLISAKPDDARGRGTDRAGRIWWRAPDHSFYWRFPGEGREPRRRPRNAAAGVKRGPARPPPPTTPPGRRIRGLARAGCGRRRRAPARRRGPSS